MGDGDLNRRSRGPAANPLRTPLARRADRAAGWFLHALLLLLSALAGSLAGFVVCLYVIMGFWLGESDLGMSPEKLGALGAVVGAVVGALAYGLLHMRRP